MIKPTYEYNNNLISKFINDSKEEFNPYNSYNEEKMKHLRRYIKDTIFIIKPNPTSNLKFLCYRLSSCVTQFTVYNDSLECRHNLELQYNELDYKILDILDFDSFIKTLRVYKEVNKTSNNVLLSDGNIYDYNKMEISKEVSDLPTVYTDNYGYSELTTDEKQIVLDSLKLQYPIQKDFIFFLTYVYCILNKSKIKQSIFVNIDESGVGKSSKIMFSAVLGLNKIANSRLLKSSELYNIASINTLFVNELQESKINASNLNNLADSTPLTVTRKSDSAVTIKSEDKPLIVLLGENLPLFEKLSDGTNRRFYLVPKVSNTFNSDRDTNIMYRKFSDIMYGDKPIGVLLYFIELFNEYDIVNNIEKNVSDMSIGIKELKELFINPNTIFNKYFNLYPLDKTDVNSTYYCIGVNQSLTKFLHIIDEKEFKSNHYIDMETMKKDLFDYIKSTNELRNIKKDLGFSTIGIGNNKREYVYYSISITDYSKKIIDEYNLDHTDKIHIKDMFFNN